MVWIHIFVACFMPGKIYSIEIQDSSIVLLKSCAMFCALFLFPLIFVWGIPCLTWRCIKCWIFKLLSCHVMYFIVIFINILVAKYFTESNKLSVYVFLSMHVSFLHCHHAVHIFCEKECHYTLLNYFSETSENQTSSWWGQKFCFLRFSVSWGFPDYRSQSLAQWLLCW